MSNSRVEKANPNSKRQRLTSITVTESDYRGDNFSQSAITHGKEYNRKEKSLGELCRRFLSIYGKQQKDFLLLD